MKLFSLDEIEHTHGTVQLIDRGGHLQLQDGTDIVLVPQPSRTDPNDPLSWPRWKRLTAYMAILCFSGMTNFGISGISPGFGQLEEEFGATIDQLTYLISVTGLGMGMGCYTITPLATLLGKRPIWLGCMTVNLVCNIWAASAHSYPSLLVARFLASWAGGVSEPLSIATLNDLFFLHERGTWAGAQALSLSIGNSLAPIVSGFLIQARGWRSYHWLVSGLCGLNWLLIAFLYPETAYVRDLHNSMDATGVNSESDEPETSTFDFGDQKSTAVERETNASSPVDRIPKKTYFEELKPWSTPRKDVSLWGAYLRPWAIFRLPTFTWVILAYSLHVTAIIIILDLLPINLASPPYGFTTSQIGLTYISNLIGNLVGCYVCGYLNDVLAQYSARRNKGVFEPEMRLPMMLIPIIFGPAGLLMYGIGIAKQAHWIVPVFGDGLVGVALTGAPSFLQPYIMDSYYPVSGDALISFNGMKNFIFFGIGFAIVPWVKRDGMIGCFSIFVGILFAIDCLAIVIWLYGKRLRLMDTKLKIFPF